ncbi:hypothetical protein TWF106_007921 [Orbilia oligospora]|uniref:Uncharacterized protein n=1 Tax=Orbilia oligospora TaxID=2813651 RepID=A0A7C8QKX6_ORBOL|nr:hypothetical protein TWF106_007921 [Orbilia oligospora]
MHDGLQQLIIARSQGGTRPKTRRIADGVILMHLPPGYELNNKLKFNNSLFPVYGELSVLYIDDPKHATELIELVRLRATSPLINSIPPKRRAKPLPPHSEHAENIQYIGDFLDEEEENQASQYRHVMGRIHEVIISGLLKYVSSEPGNDKTKVLAYLQNLGRASPVWEDRVKKLLLEEHKVLQDMIKEIQGGWPFLQHFLSSNMITANQWERLVITAMTETVRKSPVLRDYHMVVYDVSIDHFIHGKVGETLLTSLDAWKCDVESINSDSFRINSPFMTSRKHPMQRLDELGEKFFRKLTNTYQSGELLYTRAVLCRSILTTYFFQAFISVWDDCVLNGHLQGLKGLVPVYPKIMDRLRDHMAHGTCPRESHPGTRRKLAQGEAGDIPCILPPKPSRILVVQAAVSEDVEMVDADPLSDSSSETIIQQDESRPSVAPSISKEEERRRKRRDRRKQVRKATLITIEQKPTQGSSATGGPLVTRIERLEFPSGGPIEVLDAASTPSQMMKTPDETKASLETQPLISSRGISRLEDEPKHLGLALEVSNGGSEVTEEVEKITLPEASVGGQNYIKNRAKKERRKARAANIAALQAEQTSPKVEQNAVVSPPVKEIAPILEEQSSKRNEPYSKENLKPTEKAEEIKLSNTGVPLQSTGELTKTVHQKQENKMPRRRKTTTQVALRTVPGAIVIGPTAQQAVQTNQPAAPKSQASTPSKPDSDLYDDPEAIAAGIKASEEEESSWTKVGCKKPEVSKTAKFMEIRGLRSFGHGHNAVFPNKNVPPGPHPHHKLNPKASGVQGKSLPVQNKDKVGPPQGQGKTTSPHVQVKVVSPQSEIKVTTPQSQTRSVATNQIQTKPAQNQTIPKPDVAKTSTPSKKPSPKKSQQPSGKQHRQKREARLPVINSMKEFPTLTTSTKLLGRQKDSQSTGGQPMDMIVELASHEVESPAFTHTTTASTIGETKASDKDSIQKKSQSASVVSPSHPVSSVKTQKSESSIAPRAVEQKEDTTIITITIPKATESASENLAVKGQVYDTEAKEPITEPKGTPDLSTSTSPLAGTSNKSTAPVTPTRPLTKRERRALAKKIAEEQKVPKLSIKERAELRRSLENKKSPESAEKVKDGPVVPVVVHEEASTTESPGIAHPGTQTISPAITDAGNPVVSSVDGETSTVPSVSPGIVHPGTSALSPGNVHPGTSTEVNTNTSGQIKLASGVNNGMRYEVVATQEAATILGGATTWVPAPAPGFSQPGYGPGVGGFVGGPPQSNNFGGVG